MAKLNTDGIREKTGLNAGTNYYARMIPIDDIIEDSELENIVRFEINEELVEIIRASMLEEGYHAEEPLVLWKGRKVIVEGHTRLLAARRAGLKEVPVVEKEFADKAEASLYIFERQANRRNLTQGEILTIAAALRKKSEYDGGGRAAERLAERLGIGKSTIYKARAIANEAGEEELKAIRKGEATINSVYNRIRGKDRSKENAGTAKTFYETEIEENDNSGKYAEAFEESETDNEAGMDVTESVDSAPPLSEEAGYNGAPFPLEKPIALLREAEEDERIRSAEGNVKIIEAINILLQLNNRSTA